MAYLFSEILFTLLVVAALGAVAGWLVASISASRRLADVEARWRARLKAVRAQERLAAARAQLEEKGVEAGESDLEPPVLALALSRRGDAEGKGLTWGGGPVGVGSEDPAAAAGTGPEGEPVPASRDEVPVAEEEDRDDLTDIKGIGPALEARLVAAGVTTFRQIATWSEEEVEVLEGMIRGLRGRLRRYDWIGQARERVPAEPEAGERDDLTEIRGIGPAMETRLVAAGVTTFRQIATWSEAEVEELDREVRGLRGSLRRYDWIGQAKARLPVDPVRVEPDDLTEIKGIGPALEARLAAAGVTTFRQIAGWTEAEVARLEREVPGLAARLRRYDWTGQARRRSERDADAPPAARVGGRGW
jgi:predicted flap endonuclease-1-like 5' DNA nuclease